MPARGRNIHWDRRLNLTLRRFFPVGTSGMTKTAQKVLDRWLHRDMHGLAFGSDSAAWLSARTGRLICVESDPIRNAQIEAQRSKKALNLQLIPVSDTKNLTDTLHNACLDILLMDSIGQVSLALSCLPFLKPGGLLVINNINGESFSGIFADSTMQSLFSFVEDWEYEWTASKMKETVIYYSPPGEGGII